MPSSALRGDPPLQRRIVGHVGVGDGVLGVADTGGHDHAGDIAAVAGAVGIAADPDRETLAPVQEQLAQIALVERHFTLARASGISVEAGRWRCSDPWRCGSHRRRSDASLTHLLQALQDGARHLRGEWPLTGLRILAEGQLLAGPQSGELLAREPEVDLDGPQPSRASFSNSHLSAGVVWARARASSTDSPRYGR